MIGEVTRMRRDVWIPGLFLAAAAAVLAAAALLSERKNARAETVYAPMEPVRIAVAADVHAIAPALTDGGAYFTQVITNADGKLMQYSAEITAALADAMCAARPDVLILPGDLTFNGARESHTALIGSLRRIEAAGVRVLVLPGNHDLENPMAARFHGDGFERVESVTSAEFAALYADFGYGDALSRDDASLSYMSAASDGLRLLFVDTNAPGAPGAVQPETLTWIEAQLQAAQDAGARVICVTHQTILQHNSVFADGFVIENREALLSLLQRCGVACSLCGHMHIQHIRTLGSLTEIVTSALSVWPCQYGVLDISAEGGVYRTQALGVPSVPDFDAQAEAFFNENTLRQSRAAVAGLEDADAMLAYIAAMNRAYYSGRMDTVTADETLLAAWDDADPFLGAYLRSLAEDAGRDLTQTEFTF